MEKGSTRSVEIVSNTAVWYYSGQPPLPLRWFPKGKFTPALAGDARETQALLSTELTVSPVQIIRGVVLRW